LAPFEPAKVEFYPSATATGSVFLWPKFVKFAGADRSSGIGSAMPIM
jgi:hypothetical protein